VHQQMRDCGRATLGGPLPPAEWDHHAQTRIHHPAGGRFIRGEGRDSQGRRLFTLRPRGRVTVASLAAGWLDRQLQSLSPSYYRTISYAYGKHVGPKWGNVPVAKVGSLDVNAWTVSMSHNGSSATVVKRAISILAGVLDDAVEYKAGAFNYARRFKRGEKPRKAPKKKIYLAEADVCRLPEESGSYADLVLTLAVTGLRSVKRSRCAWTISSSSSAESRYTVTLSRSARTSRSARPKAKRTGKFRYPSRY
jgi:hypothetical protein